MTKQFKIKRIGIKCTMGIGRCRASTNVVNKQVIDNSCPGSHRYEVVIPGELYVEIFDTIRPEQFIEFGE